MFRPAAAALPLLALLHWAPSHTVAVDSAVQEARLRAPRPGPQFTIESLAEWIAERSLGDFDAFEKGGENLIT